MDYSLRLGLDACDGWVAIMGFNATLTANVKPWQTFLVMEKSTEMQEETTNCNTAEIPNT